MENRLIAEFMGFEIPSLVQENPKWIKAHISKVTLRYDTSWDWLMPVLEKIVGEDSSNFHVGGPGYSSSTDNWEFSMLDDQTNGQSSSGKTLIEATYESVVKYLKQRDGK